MVFQCTLATCSVETWGWVKYLPSMPGNIIFLVIFFLLLVAQIYLANRYRTTGVSISLCLGLLGEIIGYVGRILLHYNPFWKDYFLVYLISLTIAPTLLAAGIYLCMARIVVVYDNDEKRVSRWRARSYTLVFLGWDILSLLLQAAGGAIASLAVTQTAVTLGTNIMVAGLAVQVASLMLFMSLCTDLAIRVRTRKAELDPTHAALYNSPTFKKFLLALALATVCIFVRSVYRVAELSEGFKGPLANNEVTFMVLDGIMVIIACVCLTVMHPGIGFGSVWQEANFHFRTRKTGQPRTGVEMRGSSNEISENSETKGAGAKVYDA